MVAREKDRVIGRTRRWFYIQLAPSRWRKEGLSPLNRLSVFLIVFSVFLQILETEKAFWDEHKDLFVLMDWILVSFFIVEFSLRIWVNGLNAQYAGFWGKMRFLRRPVSLIDLFTIIPFFITFGGSNLLWVRAFRALRIFSLAKFDRFTVAFKLLFHSITERSFELGITVILSLMAMILSATALYLIEGSVQPEKFGSIPRALWWSMSALTTTGYGDVYPITALGKIVASITAITGIALVAMPTGILAASFSQAFQKRKYHQAKQGHII
ncbi:MAG: ion transporter [Alphaproteobacteria bacterium]